MVSITARLRLTLAASLLSLSAAGATTIAVPGDAPTIARGLALARPGDRVLVACGTYREHDLVIPAGVSLWSGTMQPGCVVIDAGGAGRVLICEGVDSTSTIVGFTLTGGRALGEGDAGRGGAVLCRNGSPRLSKCVLRGNSARDGGAVAVVGSGRPVLSDCRLWGNEAQNAGGAVVWRGVLGGRLEGCELRDNTAGSAGGALYAVEAGLELRGCVLAEQHRRRGRCGPGFRRHPGARRGLHADGQPHRNRRGRCACRRCRDLVRPLSDRLQ